MSRDGSVLSHVDAAGRARMVDVSDKPETARTATAALALFEELAMTLPPEGDQRERISVARSKSYAAKRGWLPPLALDLDEDSTPSCDDQGVSVQSLNERRLEDYEWLIGGGCSHDEALRRLGISHAAWEKAVDRARKDSAA